MFVTSHRLQMGIVLLHHVLIFLGDLHRYLESAESKTLYRVLADFKETFIYFLPKCIFFFFMSLPQKKFSLTLNQAAGLLCPKVGKPYNQQAVLALANE